MATTITFKSGTRNDADGNPAVLGTIRQTRQGLTGEGLGSDIMGAARNRLWDDDKIVQFYTNWSNGYVFSTAQ